MSTATLYRMAGLALLAGALLTAVGTTLNSVLFPGSVVPTPSTNVLFVTVNLVSLVGIILLVLGVPAITAAQRAQAGRLGFLGIVLTIIGGILFAGATVFFIIAGPWLDEVAPQVLANVANGPPGLLVLFLVASLSLGVGGLMLGIATIRARVFAKWIGWLIIIGALVGLLNFIPTNDTLNTIISTVSNIISFVGFGWIGYSLYTGAWQAAAAAHANG